ncbi:porin [Curvibacter sp. CHRR-16]|uniref:porin n=1 Tax=Curvibacter sp. CHRR-16 TaxID=2835872 RepID=UPI001BDA5AF1|nr:porin [Curvibacter sp. CHRR-16]MBT0571173.1 porin [Curvibacter sp. CHRR-16]
MQHFKHSLIPLALCAVATAANAQSNITTGNDAVQMSISGRIDLEMLNKYSLSTTNNTTGTQEAIDDGSTGRIKFSGTSKISDDLNSFFDLELRAKFDSGTQDDSTALFKDKAWVGLNSVKYGTMRMGRMSGPLNDIVVAGRYEAFGGDSYASMGSRQASATDKWNNAFNYQTPVFDGFAAGFTFRKGESATAANSAGFYGTYANPAGTGLGLSVGWQQEQDSVYTTAMNDMETAGLGINYKFSNNVTIMSTWARTSRLGQNDNLSNTTFTAGAKVPYGPGEIRVSYENIDMSGAFSTEVDKELVSIGYHWPLNKSTSVNFSLKNEKNKNFNSDGSDKNTVQGTGYGVGLRMAF